MVCIVCCLAIEGDAGHRFPSLAGPGGHALLGLHAQNVTRETIRNTIHSIDAIVGITYLCIAFNIVHWWCRLSLTVKSALCVVVPLKGMLSRRPFLGPAPCHVMQQPSLMVNIACVLLCRCELVMHTGKCERTA